MSVAIWMWEAGGDPGDGDTLLGHHWKDEKLL